MEKETKGYVFDISTAQDIANLSVAISEIDALARKMGGTVAAPVTVPTGVVPDYTAVSLTLVFSAKDLHEYAAQSRGQGRNVRHAGADNGGADGNGDEGVNK